MTVSNDNKKITVYCILNFLYWFHIWFLMIYFPLYAKQSNISDLNIGLILTVFNTVSLIVMIPFGILTDYFGAKKIIILGACGLLLWTIGLAFGDTFQSFLLSYLVGGAGSVLFLISLNTAFYSALETRNSTKYITLYYACSTVGFMIGPFIGGLLTEYFGYAAAFKIDIFIIILLFVFIYKSELPPKVEFHFSDYLKDIKNPKIILFIIMTAVFYSHYGVEQTAYTLLMKNNIKLDNAQIGNIFIILGFWISIVTLVVGRLSKSKFLILLNAGGLILCGVFQFFTGYSENAVFFVIVRLLHTFGDAICSLTLGILVTYVFSKSRLGFSFGFFLMAQLIASIPFSYISGYLSKNNDYSMPFYFNGIFIVFAAIIILLTRRKIRSVIGLDKN